MSKLLSGEFTAIAPWVTTESSVSLTVTGPLFVLPHIIFQPVRVTWLAVAEYVLEPRGVIVHVGEPLISE
jgi:hypothetical protein